jgi:hypothetical protein
VIKTQGAPIFVVEKDVYLAERWVPFTLILLWLWLFNGLFFAFLNKGSSKTPQKPFWKKCTEAHFHKKFEWIFLPLSFPPSGFYFPESNELEKNSGCF